MVFPLAMAGKFSQAPISSFTVETLALDEAIDYVQEVVIGIPVSTSQ